jgi:hypothetical protein
MCAAEAPSPRNRLLQGNTASRTEPIEAGVGDRPAPPRNASNRMRIGIAAKRQCVASQFASMEPDDLNLGCEPATISQQRSQQPAESTQRPRFQLNADDNRSAMNQKIATQFDELAEALYDCCR